MNRTKILGEHDSKETIPQAAILKVSVAIDQDKWEELEKQGYTQADIEKDIKKAITIVIPSSKSVAWDILDVGILKFY